MIWLTTFTHNFQKTLSLNSEIYLDSMVPFGSMFLLTNVYANEKLLPIPLGCLWFHLSSVITKTVISLSIFIDGAHHLY